MAEYKVVAVNGSPHVGFGNTSQLIDAIGAGLAEHGVEMEHIYLADKQIDYCIGCALCLDKGKCWCNDDDYNEVAKKVLDADGVILGSPVYVMNCTGQMKTFLDRSLPYGHKPQSSWKPGLAVSVSAGMYDVKVADYLAMVLRIFGAYPLNRLAAIAVSPGQFVGKDAVMQRAADMARDLAVAIKEKRMFPPNENDLFFWRFMGNLVAENKDVMEHDYVHWDEAGLYDGFEAYVQQPTAPRLANDPESVREWRKMTIAETIKKKKAAK